MPQRPPIQRHLPGISAPSKPQERMTSAQYRTVVKRSRGGDPKALENLLLSQIRGMRLPEPIREHRFHVERRWRFDFAWPDLRIAVEVDGGGWVQGRHGRGQGIEDDAEKYSEAAIDGWRVLRCTGKQIKSETAIRWVFRALRHANDTH